MPASDWDSFALGYGRRLDDSPVLGLCMAVQILRDWSVMTKADLARGAVHERRFQGVKYIFGEMKAAGF